MREKANKNIYIWYEDLFTRHLRCWNCGELLSPSDVECFNQCPYCGAAIERNAELDDFAIEPLTQQWVNRYPMMKK